MPRTAKFRTPFAQRLSQIRGAKGITQRELARLVKVSPRVIGLYETVIKNPTPDILLRLASALKVSMDELMGHKPISVKNDIDQKMLRKLLTLKQLSPKAQRSVLGMIDALRAEQKKT